MSPYFFPITVEIYFNQKFTSKIKGFEYSTFEYADVIILNDNVKYESNSKMIIINREFLKILNKETNQVFIDNTYKEYELLLSISLLDLLKQSKFMFLDEN